MKSLALTLMLVVFSSTFFAARAEAFVELNGFVTNENVNSGTAVTGSRFYFEGSLGFKIDHDGRWLAGWNYGIFNKTDGGTSTTTYQSSQMGPRFVWFVTKSKAWSVGFAYNIITKATYDSGNGVSETWKGTAIKFDAGYNYDLTDWLMVGVRLNYNSASYSEKLVNSNYSTISNTSVLMYPSAYTVIIF